jgi:nitrogen fixation NifU-like protein
MNATEDLYQQMILDHNRNPHNFGKPTSHTHMAEGDNPLCGDHYDVYLTVNDSGTIQAVAFEGAGCAISKASASLMTDALIGKTTAEADTMFHVFHDVVMGKDKDTPDAERALGKLAVFSGIWKYPSRVKCAILCWHAVRAALEKSARATTEETP